MLPGPRFGSIGLRSRGRHGQGGSAEGLQYGERSTGRAEAPGAASPEIFRMGFAMAWIFLTAPALAEGRKRSGLA